MARPGYQEYVPDYLPFVKLKSDPLFKLILVRDLTPSERVEYIWENLKDPETHVRFYQKLGNVALPLLDVFRGVYGDFNSLPGAFVPLLMAPEDILALIANGEFTLPAEYQLSRDGLITVESILEVTDILIKKDEYGQLTEDDLNLIEDMCTDANVEKFKALVKERMRVRMEYLLSQARFLGHCFLAFGEYSEFHSNAVKVLAEYYTKHAQTTGARFISYSLLDICHLAMGIQTEPNGVVEDPMQVSLAEDWLVWLGPNTVDANRTIRKLFVRLGQLPLGSNPLHSRFMLNKNHFDGGTDQRTNDLIDAWSMLLYMYVCMVGRGARYGPVEIREHNTNPLGRHEIVNKSTEFWAIPLIEPLIDIRAGYDQPLGFAWKTLHTSVLNLSTDAYIQEIKDLQNFTQGGSIPACNAFGLLLDGDKPIRSQSRDVRSLIASGTPWNFLFIYMPRLSEGFNTDDASANTVQEMALISLLYYRDLINYQNGYDFTKSAVAPYLLGYKSPEDWHYNFFDGVFTFETFQRIPDRARKNLNGQKFDGPSDEDLQAWGALRNAMFILKGEIPCDDDDQKLLRVKKGKTAPREFFLGLGGLQPPEESDNNDDDGDTALGSRYPPNQLEDPDLADLMYFGDFAS